MLYVQFEGLVGDSRCPSELPIESLSRDELSMSRVAVPNGRIPSANGGGGIHVQYSYSILQRS
jgi:hypothetical protein